MRQSPAQRQTQARPFDTPLQRARQLGELLEDAPLVLRGDAYTCVGHAETDRLTIFAQLRRHTHFTLLGELDGIGNEIAQDLRDLAFVVV